MEIGTWTSPGDYGDKRGVYTPQWWKLKGSQYGKLKTWAQTVAEIHEFVGWVARSVTHRVRARRSDGCRFARPILRTYLWRE